MERVAVLTSGLWRLRHEVAALTGMEPVRYVPFAPLGFSAVAGWGHAPTADRARRLARRRGVPYLAVEDGPLRSIRPGPAEPPMSLLLDRSGIYYRAAEPSDLFEIMADPSWFSAAMADRAAQAIATLQHERLSKYNSGPARPPEQLGLSNARNARVLVLDQVRGDASIRGAQADEHSFRNMLAAARDENPRAEIVLKLHPDVVSGRRRGYLEHTIAGAQLAIVADQVNPWSLIEAVDAVYTVSSGLGFEAALAGKRVVCFGSPFYSGWGFTEDRSARLVRPRPASASHLFAAYYLKYARYFDAYSRKEVPFETAAAQLAWLRDRFMQNGTRAVCYRVGRWKRPPVNAMLDGPAGPPVHAATRRSALQRARAEQGSVVAWASKDRSDLKDLCTAAAIPFIQVEDGFLRSAGLGATFVPPLSLVFDRRGIYYDSRGPSDLEHILQTAEFTPALLQQAARLRQKLVAAGLSKYNVGLTRRGFAFDSGGRPVILVPGQVEDDASIRTGSPHVRTNLELLEAVRQRHPDGYIVYKPHPDVEAGLRRGRIAAGQAKVLANHIATNASIIDLIQACDRLATMSSLAGFEALLRGIPVTTYGQPFYCGWGLTEDVHPVARRTRSLTIDDLVAGALILYPRYVDPVTGRRCGPELLIERLADARNRPRTAWVSAVRAAQSTAGRALHISKQLARILP